MNVENIRFHSYSSPWTFQWNLTSQTCTKAGEHTSICSNFLSLKAESVFAGQEQLPWNGMTWNNKTNATQQMADKSQECVNSHLWHSPSVQVQTVRKRWNTLHKAATNYFVFFLNHSRNRFNLLEIVVNCKYSVLLKLHCLFSLYCKRSTLQCCTTTTAKSNYSHHNWIPLI